MENAFQYFIEKTGENGLYLLDEPENSLSPKTAIRAQGVLLKIPHAFLRANLSFHPFTFSSFYRPRQNHDLDANPCHHTKMD